GVGAMSCVAKSRSVWHRPDACTSTSTSRPVGEAMSTSSRSNPRLSAFRTSSFMSRLCDNPDRYVQDFVRIHPIPERYRMELRHLRYFVAVGEEQHFGRAAARLHVAQPPLSRQIQDLEREIGFPLFDRLPRGVRLSAAGRLFLNDTRRILQDVEDAKRRAEGVALGKAGTLRIGIATAVSWHGMVAQTFREFRRRQPDAELEVHHLLSVRQIEGVLSGRLDAGFAASMTPWHKDLAHAPIAEDRMMLAVPKGHALARRGRIRLRDLEEVPFIWFQRWVN